MDAALLREREAFKKRALATPVVETRKKRDAHQPPPKKKSKSSSHSSASGSHKEPVKSNLVLKSSQYRFAALAKIVKYMKQRHQDGDTHPLSIDEILDETNQLDVGPRQKHWLVTEALAVNPKIQVNAEGKYSFKPAYNIKDRKGLYRLLDKHDQRGLGGILQDDIRESLPNADKAIKSLGDNIQFIKRPTDKNVVLFFNDKNFGFNVDEEFQKLWRSIAVDGIDDNKIEEYLEKQGIASMQDMGVKKVNPVQRRKRPVQKKSHSFKRHNEHMKDILQDYSDVQK